jgi:hypothetical protein
MQRHLITFTNNERSEIYVVPVAGGRPRRLAGQAAGSTFSPEGRWIYFVSNRAGAAQILRMPASGGEAVVLVSNVAVFATSVKPSPDGAFLYWAETGSGLGAVWRAPSEGGTPVKVIEEVLDGTFRLTDKGIYYVDRAAGETRLQYLDFATSKTSTVARNLGELWTGVGVSPDRSTVYYSRLDTSSDDLMLVENFR